MSLRFDTFVSEHATFDPAPGTGLNVGCGHDVLDGFVNLDVADLPGVDVVASLGDEPLPFADGTFRTVLARDVLEHVDIVPALRELHRVMAPGGVLVISTVHFTSRNLWVDPTHRRGFSARTLEMFCPEGRGLERSYYFDFGFSQCRATVIQFSAELGAGRYLVWDRLVEPVVNRSRRSQDLYEMTAAARIFPAANVLCALVR
jgi:SAM-dependent methyltransferase